MPVQLNVSTEDKKIVKMLADGSTVPEIAEGFSINTRTFEKRISLLKNMYGCKNITNLVAYFLRNKLIK